ncbi:hypothetical protein [Poseidonocella sedimentorum]|uniref:hypothetical protein n=1 Tax=Poseidonocella sedimentorum TaxID=871652 RepID=UPI0015A69AD3|nr:hypothetical protein [Poseidonocella sedimentorum]
MPFVSLLQTASFSDFPSTERPAIARAQGLAIAAFVGFGALVQMILATTLASSFDPP